MTLLVRPIRLHLRSHTGTPLAGAQVQATLSAYQVDGVDVVPLQWDLAEDPAVPGDYTGHIWPNTRTGDGTFYTLIAHASGWLMQRVEVTIVDDPIAAETELTVQVNPPPYPALYEAQAEVAAARVFSNAAGESASRAMASFDQASALLASSLRVPEPTIVDLPNAALRRGKLLAFTDTPSASPSVFVPAADSATGLALVLSQDGGTTNIGHRRAGGLSRRLADKLGEIVGPQDVGLPGQPGWAPMMCAIRNNGDRSNEYQYWRVIRESKHASLGIRNALGAGFDVSTNGERIRIHHDFLSTVTIGGASLVDETGAQLNLRIGPSVGEVYSDISMFRDLRAVLTRSEDGVWRVASGKGIKELYWDALGRSLYVSHDYCPTAAININPQAGDSPGQWHAQATAIDSVTTRVEFHRLRGLVHAGRIAWKGEPGYGFTGDAQNLSIASYNSSNGELVINAVGGNLFGYQVSVSPFNTTFRPVVKAVGQSSITVFVLDKDGNKVTSAPTLACEFIVQATSRVQPEQPPVRTNFSLRWSSESNIDPRTITAVDYPSLNIWWWGILGYL